METKHHTFAIRLALRYFIMRCHPNIKAMPSDIPKKSPEIKPIFPVSKNRFPFETNNKKITKIKVPNEETQKFQTVDTQQNKNQQKIQTYTEELKKISQKGISQIDD